MFKFSVSFATEVEKNTDHRMDVLIEVFAPQDSKRATNYVHDLKSLLLSWNCILVHSVAVMVCVWELRECKNVFIVSIPKKEKKYANSKWILRNLFCCCSNLSNLKARSENGCKK